MLGEKFTEHVGKVTGVRVIPGDEHAPAVETSFAGNGKLYGMETTEMGTYISRLQPSGVMVGEGQGIVMTKDGEAITWKAQGVGRPTGKGMAASYRYALTFQTSSQKHAKLNTFMAVGEWEVDEQGNTRGNGWEWK